MLPMVKTVYQHQVKKTGRGIATFYNSDCKITEKKAYKFPAMECTDHRLQMDGKSTILGVFYHQDSIHFFTFIENFLFSIITLFTSIIYISNLVKKINIVEFRKNKTSDTSLLTQILSKPWMMVMKYLILKSWLIILIDYCIIFWKNMHLLKLRNVS